MDFTGLEIYKLLPKTNCGDCKCANCLAFAMKVAVKKAGYELCPHLSKEARLIFSEQSKPIIKPVAIFKGSSRKIIGDEKVMFRHEESFYNSTAVAVKISKDTSREDFIKKLDLIKNFSMERTGQIFQVDLLALEEGPNSLDFTDIILKETDFSVIVLKPSLDKLNEYIKFNKNNRLIFAGIDLDNYKGYVDILKDKEIILCLEEEEAKLENLVKALEDAGFKNIVLSCPSSNSFKQKMNFLYRLREGAIQRKKSWHSYPTFMEVNASGIDGALASSAFITRYASLIILEDFSLEGLIAVMTLRQNIFSDPRKPLQVESKLYSFGKVDESSPVLVTTNFSLTYHLVSSEIESSPVPAYLLVVETHGTSVLSAFASDKFNAEIIAGHADKFEVRKHVNHNSLVIPGLVSILRKNIEKKFDYRVIVGPREASGIPGFLKELVKTDGARL